MMPITQLRLKNPHSLNTPQLAAIGIFYFQCPHQAKDCCREVESLRFAQFVSCLRQQSDAEIAVTAFVQDSQYHSLFGLSLLISFNENCIFFKDIGTVNFLYYISIISPMIHKLSWWWLIPCLLVLGCAATIPVLQNQQAAPENNSEQLNQSISLPDLDKSGAAPCPGRFICISSLVQAYQDQDCRISNRTTCETECVDGGCLEKKIMVCAAGFKCRNQYSRGFQREDCTWDKQENCQFGCIMDTNKCSNQSAAANLPKASVENNEHETVKASYPVLSMGQATIIEGKNLTIYIIEAERIQLRLGSQRSSWLSEGQTYQFKNSVAITVREILFQPYESGKKQVVYSVN